MKILTLHCDYIKFRPLKKAIAASEELSKEQEKSTIVKECLVVFTAIEESDKKNAAELLVDNIIDIVSQVKCNNIVLYPYAHLSPYLAKPDFAMAVLKEAEKILLNKKYKVVRAPFGYYKEFELKCKGHPLSELSRSISSEGKVEKEVREIKIAKEEKYDYKQLLSQISKVTLDTSKLKENDHRIIGQKLDLFSFNEVAPGMVFWHHNGWIICQELIKFWREEHAKANYQEISTPQIMDSKLWKISGHWEKYRENIFLTKYEDRDFAVKPMNCPGGILVYRTKPRSYKELPLRIAELGTVHRQELSGVLGGLFRLIKFTQDDAHIYCTENQLEDEIEGVIKLVETLYKPFKFNYHIELSTRPEKRIGTDEMWNKAEKALESVLKKRKIKYKIMKGAGAFYGPKIDFHIKDSLGRTWQCATIQVDFAMPERFDLTYMGEDNKKYRPVMIHRAIYGSIERFVGILLEHFNGNLPLWLSPIQVRVLSFTDRNVKTAEKIVKTLEKEDLRVDSDFRDATVDYKVREAEIQRIPYIIVIGDKEEKQGTLAVRARGKKPEFGVRFESFIKEIKEKIGNRD
ncbi:MAG: threonine--tRNA ligase [Candidatus Pacearchaeota archaeon]|nr:threonine--tRNA ligase [Candidatus Pacearchaeota archaeon]